MSGARRIGGLGLALILTAATLDAEPLYVPGVALTCVALGAVAWVLVAARGLRVTRELPAAHVVEEQPVTAHLRVSAPWMLAAAGTLEDPLLDGPAPIATGDAVAVRGLAVTARFPRRGRHRLAPPRVRVRDPFGLAEREAVGDADEILVLPAVLPVHRHGAGGAGDALGRRVGHARLAAEIELDGLRPLRAGTSAARISWATWARTGELLERHLRPDGDDRPVVVLDTRLADPGETAPLDAAVRAAASLCVHLAREGGCALLLPGDRQPTAIDPGLVAWPRQHVRLAVVPAGGPPAGAALTGRAGVTFYVAAQALTGVPRLLAQAPGRGRVLVVPGAMPGRHAAFHVAGCHGYDLAPRGAARGAVA